jgi:hypothetical protein
MKERMNDDDNNKTRREIKKKRGWGRQREKLLAIGSRLASILTINRHLGSLFFSEHHHYFPVSFFSFFFFLFLTKRPIDLNLNGSELDVK